MSKEIYDQIVNHKTWDQNNREFVWTDAKYYDMCHGPYAVSNRRRLIFQRRLEIVEHMVLSVYKGNLYKLVGKKVLDVGSGTGSMALALATWGAKVTTLDRVQEFADIADQKMKWFDGKGVCDSAYDLPFEDSSFDLILTTNFWDTGTLNDKDRLTAVGEMKRVLIPGGYLINTIRNASNPYIRRTERDPITKKKVMDVHNRIGLELLEIGAYSSPSPWPGYKNIAIDIAQALPIDTFKAGMYFISKKP